MSHTWSLASRYGSNIVTGGVYHTLGPWLQDMVATLLQVMFIIQFWPFASRSGSTIITGDVYHTLCPWLQDMVATLLQVMFITLFALGFKIW